ncbi:MAG: hypothetical protein KDB01_08850 [Planctomycetaceae bacterium]|nr:hypothetical protein [Planctomycetaceae bacterium]
MQLFRYIRKAFVNHWNLLGVVGGIGFSVLSGRPEIGLPLVAAAEVAWLGFVGTHPRFQQYVDVTENEAVRSQDAAASDERMRKMFAALPRGLQNRFTELLKQCHELRAIGQGFHAASSTAEDGTVAELRSNGLDKLLWLYLKLLYTEYSLNRFFETTSLEQIQHGLKQVQERLKQEQQKPEGSQRDRIIATLQDNVVTCEQRVANFGQARDSYELVRAEQQRLETRIRSLAEMSISQGDPGTISSQVDSVAGSVAETEKTLEDLKFVTGLSSFDETVPEILPRQKVTQ